MCLLGLHRVRPRNLPLWHHNLPNTKHPASTEARKTGSARSRGPGPALMSGRSISRHAERMELGIWSPLRYQRVVVDDVKCRPVRVVVDGSHRTGGLSLGPAPPVRCVEDGELEPGGLGC